jgi:homoserine dehydrogenase
VVTNVHRVLGIVNGTCNFMLTRIAFGSQVTLDSVVYAGIEGLRAEHLRPAKKLDMVVRLVGSASLVDAKVDVRVQPSLIDRHHPLAGALGATLSGSGPSVVVWARSEAAETCRSALAERFESARVLQLSVTPKGAYGQADD